jgi:O-antigen/teichoic acid export membrane protein
MIKSAVSELLKSTKSKLLKNSAWGLLSNLLQNLLLSVFFIIIARVYTKDTFGNYIIANTIYSFVLGFSTLGLGHWFIREYINIEDKKTILYKFFKMQLYTGILFFIISVSVSYLLYSNSLIRYLSLIMGINIIFDNLIYVIKYLNIAQLEQKRSFILTTFEALLKCMTAAVLYFYFIPIEYIVIVLIVLRLITLNLFITYGSSNQINLKEIILVKVNYPEIKKIVLANWTFVVIGSLSVVNWRIGSIFVSKFLTTEDVANYEVSFKLLSLAYIIPVVAASSIYPMLINALKKSKDNLKAVYHRIFIPLTIFGLLAFTFIYSYVDYFIPLLFGEKFADTSQYCKQMFLVIIIFPTFLLQADVIITLGLEKLDMFCNLISISINITLCFIGLTFYKDLSVVNYSIFISILVFHLIQDVILIRKKIIEISKVIKFYVYTFIIVYAYYLLSNAIPKEILFVVFWLLIAVVFSFIYFYKKRNNLNVNIE